MRLRAELGCVHARCVRASRASTSTHLHLCVGCWRGVPSPPHVCKRMVHANGGMEGARCSLCAHARVRLGGIRAFYHSSPHPLSWSAPGSHGHAQVDPRNTRRRERQQQAGGAGWEEACLRERERCAPVREHWPARRAAVWEEGWVVVACTHAGMRGVCGAWACRCARLQSASMDACVQACPCCAMRPTHGTGVWLQTCCRVARVESVGSPTGGWWWWVGLP